MSDEAIYIRVSLSRSLSPSSVLKRTFPIMLLERFIVLPPNLGPAGEIVLRTDGVHLTLQAHDLFTQSYLLLHVFRGRPEREAAVDLP